MDDERTGVIKKASWIALAGNTVLAVAKVVAGLLSGSLAVLSDGIDSTTDVLIAIMTLGAGRISAKPGDKEHPYGHARAETIATTVIAFVLFTAGAQVLINAVTAIFSSAPETMPTTLGLWVTIVSIIGKSLLTWSQFHYGKIANSSMLIANGKNMRGDIVTSAGVLVGLILTYLTGIPVLDKVLAALVALWIIKNAVSIFMESNMELMDGSSDTGPYQVLFKAIHEVPEAGNPHRVRIRKSGSLLMVDLDIEVDPGMKVKDAHVIARRVEKAIKKSMPEVYDVIVHIEPQGNVEDEKYGLTPEDAVPQNADEE
ncbi:MAG TPA: cation diffusion facilitator family transporter [Spirochaetales bacterium]|nr:cation diffusion facilitator family transporter [Spirochaetales bacterium]